MSHCASHRVDEHALATPVLLESLHIKQALLRGRMPRGLRHVLVEGVAMHCRCENQLCAHSPSQHDCGYVTVQLINEPCKHKEGQDVSRQKAQPGIYFRVFGERQAHQRVRHRVLQDATRFVARMQL